MPGHSQPPTPPVHPRRSTFALALPLILILLLVPTANTSATTTPTSPTHTPRRPTPSFSRDILPILSDHCFACHGPDDATRKGGLRLDLREAALAPARSGAAAIVPHHPDRSELIARLRSQDPDEVMPPPSKAKRPLTTGEIETLQTWITSGAPWGLHWAYEPPAPLTPPRPAETRPGPPSPPTHPVDAFIHHRLAQEGLATSPEAPRPTLLRRLTLDLTGLPPTPAETAAFLADPRPDAWSRAVDRLLASPHYGERMAWDWLEAARYADSNGYQGDAERTMWPWRDWVIDAFNRNLPFDTFTLWQLAGDLLPDPTHEQRLATGFLRNHAINGEGGRIPEENRIDYLFDQTETVGTVWLGATLNCTRCHNHKFDPLTQRDYFSLVAFFNRTAVDGSGGDPQSRPTLEAPFPEQTRRRTELEAQLHDALDAVTRHESTLPPNPTAEIRESLAIEPARRDAGRLEKLAKLVQAQEPAHAHRLNELRAALLARDTLLRSIPKVMVMEDIPQPRDTYILNRGLYNQPGARVEPALPAVFTPTAGAIPTHPTSPPPNRLTLARWLVSPENPLTARVTVNRLWQSFFGTGLVKTTEDLGLQGEKPSHPELLDWLASDFVASGWDVKRLVRLLVTSATYRQSSQVDPQTAALDPENRLLARGPRYRWPSWMIRDAALAAAGHLAPTLGGPPVRPYQPEGVWEEATFGNKRYQQDHGEPLYRRSIYVFWRRIVAPTLFFDTANRATCTVRTPRTNVPLHALLTLNDTTYVEAARLLAIRLLQSPATDTLSRLHLAAHHILGRPLEPSESRVLEAGLSRHQATFHTTPDAAARLLRVGESPTPDSLNPVEVAAWTLACHTLLNLDETLTKE